MSAKKDEKVEQTEPLVTQTTQRRGEDSDIDGDRGEAANYPKRAAVDTATGNDSIEPLVGSPETFDAEGPTHPPKPTKANGLPDDEPIRISLTDPNLLVSEVSGRQWRYEYEVDEDGVLITKSERVVEIDRRNAGTDVPAGTDDATGKAAGEE